MQKHLVTILACFFATIVCGLLILNRVHIRPTLRTAIMRDEISNGNSTYKPGFVFKTGETIRTQNGEFVEFHIGPSIIIAADENSIISLKSLDSEHPEIKFGHGRIFVSVDDDGTIFQIDTPTAQNTLQDSVATFIGFDFNKSTRIVPLSGVIHTTIPLLHQSLEISTPIDILSENPPSIRSATFDLITDPRAAFYEWTK